MSRWSSRKFRGGVLQLTWSLRDAVFPKLHQGRELTQAFSLWSEVFPVIFERENNWKRADVIVGVTSEGPPGEGACAELPDGRDTPCRILFQANQPWSLSPGSGVYFRAMAAHEIGHILGLDHSDSVGTLMFPNSNGFADSPQGEDIRQALSLYGLYAHEAAVSSGRSVRDREAS